MIQEIELDFSLFSLCTYIFFLFVMLLESMEMSFGRGARNAMPAA